MPRPVMRSPLGLPLGDRGLLPLPDALPGVGAGLVAGGPYTVPKECWIPIPGRPTGRGKGLFLRALPSGLQSTDPYSTSVGMEACSTPVQSSLCVVVFPLPLCGLAVLLWRVVVSCCAVLYSVVLCRLVVPCCWGVLCVVLCCGCSFFL